jgi:hypothetical protein
MTPSRRQSQLDETESPSYGEADERNGRKRGVRGRAIGWRVALAGVEKQHA